MTGNGTHEKGSRHIRRRKSALAGMFSRKMRRLQQSRTPSTRRAADCRETKCGVKIEVSRKPFQRLAGTRGGAPRRLYAAAFRLSQQTEEPEYLTGSVLFFSLRRLLTLFTAAF